MLNLAVLTRSLAVDAKTVARYVDLLADLFLVLRLPPFYANVRKRLVKSPKIYVRDSGVVHTLLRLDDEERMLGHPVAGPSWEGFVIETLIRAASDRARAAFYRTATGVEVGLPLELPGRRLWEIEIKRASAPQGRTGAANCGGRPAARPDVHRLFREGVLPDGRRRRGDRPRSWRHRDPTPGVREARQQPDHGAGWRARSRTGTATPSTGAME